VVHRLPPQSGKERAPADQVFNPTYETPAPNQDEIGPRLVAEYKIKDARKPRRTARRVTDKTMNKDIPQYWRSLEELAQTEEFRAYVEDEFPNRTPDWNDPTSRRRFLTLMGASIALVGSSACTVQPKEVIVPTSASRKNSFPASRFTTPRR